MTEKLCKNSDQHFNNLNFTNYTHSQVLFLFPRGDTLSTKFMMDYLEYRNECVINNAFKRLQYIFKTKKITFLTRELFTPQPCCLNVPNQATLLRYIDIHRLGLPLLHGRRNRNSPPPIFFRHPPPQKKIKSVK